MAYTSIFSEGFRVSLKSIDKSVKRRVPKILEKIEKNPRMAKQLHGKWNYYRVRFLNYRILYYLNEGKGEILFLDIGKRKAIYTR